MGWIAYIILGLLAGVIAKAIMPGRDPGGLIITTLLGIVGSIIGGWVGSMLFGYGRGDSVSEPGFLMSLVLAVVGAVIVLAAYRLIRGRGLTAGS
ncbi:MAG TPA: GlsB/YeaQ/YmgE family stress response membrane protein [Pyrinomonadaceae bacterium]|jgi:uncharacterized membrane protein YeaQ/YmgE (transglycosylase-associated protein family)|nr:GlsB/YeaQ/YmgE family stress response membrane protein [Pyrinomonadaceae bacterium]